MDYLDTAAKMLNIKKSKVPYVLHKALSTIDAMCLKVGGRLRSRQIIASVVYQYQVNIEVHRFYKQVRQTKRKI